MCNRLPLVSVLLVSLLGCRGEPGFLEDRAGLLTPAERERIVGYHERLLDAFDIHLKLVILAQSPPDLDALAVEVFGTDRVGMETGGARGVLILVDPPGRQVRMEIGYGLEGIFPDSFVGAVERDQMVPFFQANRVGPGVEATVELLVGTALHALEQGAYDPAASAGPVGDRLSGGGGARAAAAIGSGQPEKAQAPESAAFEPQATPLGTLETYKEVLRLRIKDPDLPIYTPETRAFFREWLVTDAQQDNELRGLLHATEPHVFSQAERAVIQFPVGDRRAPPLFLLRGEQGWMLDFASMHRFLGFNHRNEWHFKDVENPYMFAFRDWQFDGNGFPHGKD
jgi:uncharacterized protein